MYYIHVKCVAESDLSEIGHQGVKFRTDLLTVGLTILIKSQFTYQSTLLSAIHLHMIMTTYLVHNHLKVVSLLKSIFVTSKILIILSYKISSKDTYLERWLHPYYTYTTKELLLPVENSEPENNCFAASSHSVNYTYLLSIIVLFSAFCSIIDKFLSYFFRLNDQNKVWCRLLKALAIVR